MTKYIDPADFYSIDEADPTWNEPYDYEPYDLRDEMPWCGGSGCDGTCETCTEHRRQEREATSIYEFAELYEAESLGHPYSYLASQAVQHGVAYCPTQADWYEFITPHTYAPLPEGEDEIPF